MYIFKLGCLPSYVYWVLTDCMCGDARVECSSSDAKPGDSLSAEALQSFSSRMVKRVEEAYRKWVRVGLTLKKIAEHP